MSRTRLQFIHATALMLVFIFLLTTANAQQPQPKKDSETKAPATTIDAWRTAIPEAENSAIAGDDVAVVSAAGEESPEQIEKRLNTLELRWVEAIKGRDAVALKRLLAEDFMLTGFQFATPFMDKAQYVESALGSGSSLTAFSFDKMKVRVYGDTAIVNLVFKQQATAAGKDASGDFLLTDVWVKQGKRWRVVTRHSTPQQQAAKTP